MADFPPDDFTLKVELWLQDEVYPGLLQEPYDERARVAWMAGSNGFVGRWVRGDHAGAGPDDRRQLIQHDLFRGLEEQKRRRDAQANPRLFPHPRPSRPLRRSPIPAR